MPIEVWFMRVAAAVEGLSLIGLLANVVTVHDPAVSAALGPLHGGCYLAVIASAFASPIPRRARGLALIPGIGGVLALRVEGAEANVTPNRDRTEEDHAR